MLLLPAPLDVRAGDVVAVRSSVQRLGKKGPSYDVTVELVRAGSVARSLSWTYTQKHVFPWIDRKSSRRGA